MPKVLWQSGNKFLVKDDKGTIRQVKREREMIKRGDFLQPNMDKDKFMETFGYHPTENPEEVKQYLKRKGLGNKPYGDFKQG